MKTKNFIRIWAVAIAILLCVDTVKGQATQVSDAAELETAIANLQATGGDIELTKAITVAVSVGNTYTMSTTNGNVINIALKTFTLTLDGAGTVIIGEGINIKGTTGKVVVTNGCTVNLTGDIESAVVSGHVFDVQNGILNMLGGSIKCTACSTNNATLNLNAATATANISGGSVINTSTVAASRVVRNNAGTISISGSPTITTTDKAAGILIQAAGKLYVNGSPTISATGAGSFAIMVQQASSQAVIGGTPTIVGNGTYAIQNNDNTANNLTILSSVASNAITGSISTPGGNNSIADLRAATITAAWDPASGGTKIILSYPAAAITGAARANLKVYYTTDNSAPTTASSNITNNGSITVSGSSWKIKAVLAEASKYIDSTIYVFDNTNVSGKKFAKNATELLNAITELQATGGDIELKNNIDTTPGAGNTYTLASTGRKVNINTLGYNIKIKGPGTMVVGDSVRLYGTSNVLINESNGVIRVTGGEIESTPASSDVRTINANGGNLYVTGGEISLSGGAGAGNPSAINVDNGYTTEISGGVITTDKTNARTIRVNAILKLSGNPTIKALSTGAHAILSQNGGKTIIDGSPVISAEGTGNCIQISGNNASESYVAILSAATPTLGGCPTNTNDTVAINNTTEAKASSAFIDFRSKSVVADQPSGSSFTEPTKVEFAIPGALVRGVARAKNNVVTVRVFYTKDGSAPTTASSYIMAGDSILVSEDVTIKAAMGTSVTLDPTTAQEYTYTISNPDPTKYVGSAAELAAALRDLQAAGGKIKLTANIVIAPGKKDSVFRIATQNSTDTIDIDAQGFSLTIQGTGTASDNVALEIGNNINLHGSSATMVTNTQQGIIRIMDGGSIIASPTSASPYTINATGGNFVMTGGTVKIENGTATGNPAAINVATGYTAAISGGTISTDKNGARTIRVNGTLNVSGNPTISASGDAAYAIVSLNGGQTSIDGAPIIRSNGTGASYGLYVQVSSGSTPTSAVIKRTASPTIQGYTQPVGVNGSGTSFIDLRKFSNMSATPASGHTFDVPDTVAFSTTITPTTRQDTAMLGTASWYYTIDGSNPTSSTTSTLMAKGGKMQVLTSCTIKMAIGGGGYIDNNVQSFTYTVTHPLEGKLISTYTQLKGAFADLASATPGDTSKWNLTANITVPTNANDMLIAPTNKPVKLDARGYRIMNGAGTKDVSQNIDLTFGGNIIMNSTVQGNFFQPGGAGTKLTINGGTYNLTNASYLIGIGTGQNVNDASTSWVVKNATINIGGRAGAKGVANFETVNGKSFTIDSCTVAVDSATGGIFYFAGQETVSIKNSTFTAKNSSGNMGFVSQGGSSATGPATTTILVDSVIVVADTGNLVKWPNASVIGRTATTILKTLNVTGKLNRLNKGVATYNGTFNLYDFRSYTFGPNTPKVATDTTLLMPTRVTLSCTSSSADVTAPDILYTLNGNNPTASSTVYSGAILLVSDTTLKVGLKTKGTNPVMGNEVKTYKYRFVTRSMKVKVKNVNGSDMPSMNLSVTAYGDITAKTTKTGNGEVDFAGLWSHENLRVTATTTAAGYTLMPDTMKISSLLSDSTVYFTAVATHTITVKVQDSVKNTITTPAFTVTVTGSHTKNLTTSSGQVTFTVAETDSISIATSANGYNVSPGKVTIKALQKDTTVAFTATLRKHTITVKMVDNSRNILASPSFKVVASGGLVDTATTTNGIATFSNVSELSSAITFNASASGYVVSPNQLTLSTISKDTTLAFVATAQQTGINGNKDEALTAYASGNNLFVSSNVSTVAITNTQGSLMLSARVTSTSVDLATLPSGIYFVVLKNDKNYNVVKIVKQ